jgi:hypothetical protein
MRKLSPLLASMTVFVVGGIHAEPLALEQDELKFGFIKLTITSRLSGWMSAAPSIALASLQGRLVGISHSAVSVAFFETRVAVNRFGRKIAGAIKG